MGSSGDASTGEWPVAYYGTDESKAIDIVKHGFDINKGKTFQYGKGIYCTPGPEAARGYANNYVYEVSQICNERYQNE